MTAPAPIDDSDSDNDSAASDDLVAVPGGGAGAGSPGAEPVRVGGGERERVPWWRQRRRLFYLAVVLAAIGVPWGGWHWWYWADFPMPPESVWMGMEIGGEAVPYLLVFHQRDLRRWKGDRETRRLRLVGTAWKEDNAGTKLIFGRDGRLRIERIPSGHLYSDSMFARIPNSNESQVVVVSGDGVPYEFQSQSLQGLEFDPFATPEGTEYAKLILGDSHWTGFVRCTDGHRHIEIVLSQKGRTTYRSRTFTRLPDPD